MMSRSLVSFEEVSVNKKSLQQSIATKNHANTRDATATKTRPKKEPRARGSRPRPTKKNTLACTSNKVDTIIH